MEQLEQIHEETIRDRYLTFLLGDQFFGVPISDVVQIIGMQPITTVPEFPAYAKGIINLRGSILPVIDLNLRFGRNETQYSERTCIIVIDIQSYHVGFIVDAVDEVCEISAQDVQPPPIMGKSTTANYIMGIGRHEQGVTLLLDTQQVLSETAIAQITSETEEKDD